MNKFIVKKLIKHERDSSSSGDLQLRNIQNMIRLTKENIDALNEQFAGFQDPPSFYVEVRYCFRNL